MSGRPAAADRFRAPAHRVPRPPRRAAGLLATALALPLLAATATPAAAQLLGDLRTVRFGVNAGVVAPLGDADDVFGNGVGAGGTLDVRLVNRPVGLRFDAGWQRLSVASLWEAFGIEGTANVLSGMASVTTAIPTRGGIRPYLLAGAGVHHLRGSFSFDLDAIVDEIEFARTPAAGDGAVASRAATEGASAGRSARRTVETEASSTTRAGLHAGGGLAFAIGRMELLVETRYQTVFVDDGRFTTLPVVAGLRF